MVNVLLVHLKQESELVRKVFNDQKIAPIKNDQGTLIESCNIYLTESEISKMKKETFKNIVKERIREEVREYLVKLKQTWVSQGGGRE